MKITLSLKTRGTALNLPRQLSQFMSEENPPSIFRTKSTSSPAWSTEAVGKTGTDTQHLPGNLCDSAENPPALAGPVW